MATLEITLPHDLARDAAKAGLLAPECLAAMAGKELKAGQPMELDEIMDRPSAVSAPAPMSPQQVADDIRIMRTGQRRAASR